MALVVLLYQRLSAPAVTRSRELRSDLNAQMAESIGGMGDDGRRTAVVFLAGHGEALGHPSSMDLDFVLRGV